MFERYLATFAVDPFARRTRMLLSTFAALATAVTLASAYLDERLDTERIRAPRVELDRVVVLASLRTVTPVWAEVEPPRAALRADEAPALLPCTTYDVFHNRWSPQCSVPRPGVICAMTRESCTCSPARRDPFNPALLR